MFVKIVRIYAIALIKQYEIYMINPLRFCVCATIFLSMFVNKLLPSRLKLWFIPGEYVLLMLVSDLNVSPGGVGGGGVEGYFLFGVCRYVPPKRVTFSEISPTIGSYFYDFALH